MLRWTRARVLTSALVLLACAGARAQVEFGDDFERAAGPVDGDGWTVHSGEWNLDGGVLRAGPATVEQHIYAGSPATDFPIGDFTLSVDMSFLIPDQQPVGRHAGILFCMDQPGSRDGSSGYLVWWIDREADRGLNLSRRDGGVFTKLVDGVLALDQGPPANVTVEVIGPSIRVFADDVEVISHDDESYRGGYFGLWTWSGANQEVEFDNFSLSVNPEPLIACFTVTPPRASAGDDVTFDAGCSVAQLDTITSWEWDFGDGNTAMGQVVEHTYEFPDNYVVSLLVRDDSGFTDTFERVLSVSDTILPFTDDFDRPPGPVDGWTVFSGLWTITDSGELRGQSEGESHIWAGTPAGLVSGDVTIAFDVEFLSKPEDGVGRHAAVFFFAEEPIARWGTRAYDVWWIDRPVDFGMGLHRWDAGAVGTLGRNTGATFPALVDPPRTWTITVEGSRIRVYGDGLLLIDEEDDLLPKEGHFGFWTHSNGQDVFFDNVSVRPGVFPPEVPEVFACATADPPAVPEGGTVTFDAGCSQIPAGVEVTAYRWDFGDGTTGVGERVEHTYEFEGDYFVELTIEHTGGDPRRAELAVTVVRDVLPLGETFTLPPGPNVPGWTVFQGDWSITDDGRLEVVTSGGGGMANEAQIWVGDPPTTFVGDITVEFGIEFLSHDPPQDEVGRHAGFFFYSDEPVLRWDTRSYDIWWIDRAQDFGLGLHEWPLALLSPGTFDQVLEPPSRWRVEVNGPNIRVYGDDVLYVDVDDDTRRSGHIGFWAYGNDQHVRFDDLCIVRGPSEGSPECPDAGVGVRPCFESEPAAPGVEETVRFDAGCTLIGGGIAVSAYRWDFGDGSTGTGEVVEHAYAGPGEYVVTLTVEHTAGEPRTTTRAVSVIERAALPLFEDFAQPAGPVAGWTVSSGDWSITEDERLEVVTAGTEEAHIWLGDPPLFISGDVTFEFEVEFIGHNPVPADPVGKHAGVFFYARDPVLRWENAAYDVWWIDRADDFGLGLHKWPLEILSPGTGIELPELGLEQPPERWRVEIAGASIRVYGDDELLIDREDETRREGLLGFWAYLNDQTVRFDNICIVEGPSEGSPECDVGPGERFVRGDGDSSGAINLTDGVKTLNWLFTGGAEPECLDAADANDSGDVNLTDAVFLFNWLFTGGEAPAEPTPGQGAYAPEDCGPDSTPDRDGTDLGCATTAARCP